MTEVVTFPVKTRKIEKGKTPEETLQYVLDCFNQGQTRASKILIAWAFEDEEVIEHRYIIGGDGGLLSTVGMLEVTREMVLDTE